MVRPTRDGFGEGLVELGQINKDVVVLSADLTDSTRALWFKEKYPERFFSFGIAEQDMAGAAAGFALSGKVPFTCTFGVFASGRAWDQIRVSVSYMNLNVKIAGSHGGISVGADGATHQALEEITLMRALPNMTIIVPSDSLEAKQATIAAAGFPGPVYLRLGRNPLPILTKPEDEYKIGKAKILQDGRDVSIFACGIMVFEALKAAEDLAKEGIMARVVNLHTIRPIDKDAIIESAKKTGAIISCEEHTTSGGMGGAIAEVLVENYPVPMKMVGVKEAFGESGEPGELLKKFYLTSADISAAARSILEKK